MRTACISIRLPAAICFIIMAGAPAFAITVAGRVVDENGAPVAAARVSATSSDSVISAQKPAAAPPIIGSSDAAGVFHLEVPVPGEYRVTAEREGFFLFQNAAVSLQPGSPLEIQMNRLNELAESIAVRYSPPTIDPDQPSQTKVLEGREMQNVPVPASQDFRSSLPMIPGVLQDSAGQPHFNGGVASSTNYRLNGFNLSDPATGSLSARLNVDAVQTLEWQASRYSPDTGKGSAGVLDIRTQMGDNHWRFGGTNFVPGLASERGIYLNHWSPRVIFSGPLRKGRGWFHNSSDAYYVTDTVSQLPPGQDRARSISGSNLSRFQWNLRENQILTGSFLVNLSDSSRTGLSFLNPAQATVNRRQSLFLGTVKDQFLFTGGLVEVGFANTSGYYRASPQGAQPYVVTPFGASGNFFRDETQHSGRQEWLINAYAAPRRWHGVHQFGAGFSFERSNLNSVLLRHDLTVVRADNSIVRDVRFFGAPRRSANNQEAYGYLQDKWNPNPELTVEAGFRTQWDAASGGAPPAPRLAAAWAPKFFRGAKVSLGWGIFYDPLTLNTLILTQEQSSVSTFYLPPPVNGPPIGFQNGLPYGQLQGLPLVTSLIVNQRDWNLPRFSIASFSVEDRLPWNLYSRFSLTERTGKGTMNFTEFAPNASENDYVLQPIGRQKYRAAEIALRRTFLSKYEWFAAYTRSLATTNAVIPFSIENPLISQQAGGPLDWDAPNRFIAWTWLPVDRERFPGFLRPIVGETDFQLLTDYRTGFPFTATSETGHLIGQPNDRRFPDFLTVNIALERKFPFRGYLWAFRAGVNNVLNRENPNVVNTDFDSPQFGSFGRGQARAVNVRLRFLGRK